MSEMRERVKAAIAEKFAPAIDFKAPYAKVMLDMAADAVIEAIRIVPPEMLRTIAANRDVFDWEVEAVWEAVIDEALK